MTATNVEPPRQDSAAAPEARGRAVHRLFLARELGILIALGVLVAVTAAANPRFLSAQSVRDI